MYTNSFKMSPTACVKLPNCVIVQNHAYLKQIDRGQTHDLQLIGKNL